MTQILTTKYTKEEERVILISNVLGISIGTPIGVLLGYALGFYADIKSVAFLSTEWTVLLLKTSLTVVPFSWIITILICFFLWNEDENAQLKQKVNRIFPGTLLLPLPLAFSFFVMALIIFPLCFIVLDYTNRPITGMIIGALTLLPFVAIIIAILLPETPAGKALRRFRHRLKGKLIK
jgi:hypothetical protein